MAKSKGATYAYPSHFGSHNKMVIENVSDDELQNLRSVFEVYCKRYKFNPNDETVVCQDEFGRYMTFKNRLDNRSADPCRYTGKRISLRHAVAADE